MTLARRMVYKIIALVASLVLLGCAAVWGLDSSRIAARIARDEYLELRLIQAVDEHLVAARGCVTSGKGQQRLIEQLSDAAHRLREFDAFQGTQPRDIADHEEQESTHLHLIDADLQELLKAMKDGPQSLSPDMQHRATLGIDQLLKRLKLLAGEMDETIASAQYGSHHTLVTALLILAVLSTVIVVMAILINVAQYRSVVMPLRELRDKVRKIASGQFSERLDAHGDREFTELADDFNGMVARLDELYRELEGKVRQKSKELVRSERLASVGYLASGVAHEISNPLNIISGYAELTLKELRRNQTDVSPQTQHALRIIRDETFRCKEIIEKLLSLSSKGDRPRERVSLNHLADEVASAVSALKQFSGRRIRVDCAEVDPLDVCGNETELRQVVLNLTINALDAVEPGVGEVHLRGALSNGTVELHVSDNGRGMTPEVLDQVFEPFYTTRRGSEGRGTGLGLAITQAIIESHGGTITATSEGLEQGSTFVIKLPAMRHTADVQAN